MKITKHITLSLSKIQVPEWYVKTVDTKKHDSLYASIEKHGQLFPIHVRQLAKDKYELITGRKVFSIMSKLSYVRILCCNHGYISEAESKRLALEAELPYFEIDIVELSKRLNELNQLYSVADLASTMPLTEREIESYIKSLDFDWASLKQESIRRMIAKNKNAVKHVEQPIESNKESIQYKPVSINSILDNF